MAHKTKAAERAGESASETRRIVMLTHAQGQILDVVGPLEVFDTANRFSQLRVAGKVSGRRGDTSPLYTVEVVARERGPVKMSSGIEVCADRSIDQVRGPIDTLMIAGGLGTESFFRDPDLIRWIQRRARRARRLASICTGAFLLAEAGLLDGRRATSHWGSCEALAAMYPKVDVDPDPIFVKDGNVYTSAGVTSGMDLALALVEEDHGQAVALEVARTLVLFVKRPGGQSQFSAQLSGQLAERETLQQLQSYIVENPAADLSVETLARRSAMSPRNFARVFAAQIGSTPARFVEHARIEAARRRLEETRSGIDEIADACGFGSAETMRRAFRRNLRVGPADYRSRFQSPGGSGRGRTSRAS